MTEIRVKDKLFLAVVIPMALLAAYWYGWRAEAGRRLDNLAHRHATLVDEADFPMEKRRADQALAEAQAELDAERKIPMPQSKVKADAQAHAAERERIVLQVFREAGLTVVGSAAASGQRSDSSQTGHAGELLRGTGTRPAPLRRAYTIDGRYPDVVRALETFAAREMAVIPDGVTMRAEGRNRWTVEVWL